MSYRSGHAISRIMLLIILFIPGVSGIQVTASGGSNGESGSVSMNFDTLKETSVSSQIEISGTTVEPTTAIAGPIAKFEQIHSVKDASGKCARVYVKVFNAPSGLTYTSKVLPKEGSVATQTQVSAEQWLTVPKADSIKCTATSSYGTARSASVGLEEYKSTTAGDYVTLTGYYCKALTTSTSVSASQIATSGAANSFKVYGISKEGSGTYNVNTEVKGIAGGRATFTGLSEAASAGTTIQVLQKEHIRGTFTSTASYTPVAGTQKSKTRTSNYGTDYYLNMLSAKGSSPAGIVGYYVKPGTTASKIQGAVNAAQSGDTINVASGIYKENVKIDKSLTIKGAGPTQTIVDGNKAGSVFCLGKLNYNIDVALSGMTIQRGSGTLFDVFGETSPKLCGGGILNRGKLSLTGCHISQNTADYGGGIFNRGAAKVVVKSSSIFGNKASADGGGFYNYGNSIVTGSTISANTARFGGGIQSLFTVSTLSVVSCTISGNTAHAAGGISNSGALDITSSTISGNTASLGGGGGIYNMDSGTARVMSSTISGNKASYLGGGGISNHGSLFIGGTSQITNNQAAANYGYGGGIFSTNSKVTFDGTRVAIKFNKAHLPDSLPAGTPWYRQYGIYVASGAPTKANGFNPTTQVTGNTKI